MTGAERRLKLREVGVPTPIQIHDSWCSYMGELILFSTGGVVMKIYALEADHKRCKVGITNDPMTRLKTLESQGGFTITNLLFIEVGDRAAVLEKKAHEILSHSRLSTSFGARSEWFAVPFHHALASILSVAYDIGIQFGGGESVIVNIYASEWGEKLYANEWDAASATLEADYEAFVDDAASCFDDFIHISERIERRSSELINAFNKYNEITGAERP